MPTQDRGIKDRFSQVKLEQFKSGTVKSGLVKLGQVKSGQVKMHLRMEFDSGVGPTCSDYRALNILFTQ